MCLREDRRRPIINRNRFVQLRAPVRPALVQLRAPVRPVKGLVEPRRGMLRGGRMDASSPAAASASHPAPAGLTGRARALWAPSGRRASCRTRTVLMAVADANDLMHAMQQRHASRAAPTARPKSWSGSEAGSEMPPS
eukprot:CAMPEP_0181226678 /NCGR_PEP_ID=MMETSP1096-20121128/32384_1 /TAXON_ID=156174 ORGANISM="Chrysochromulina ericina, Strain CCMP281" /NCGR_SAMPLE_ID=MMETSP1096 /ASSEMBLY_ACC=CAM_ASM_000453 /LENGTH=137 /DNA_ID=CAMNT_0023320035 /DNA_START=376 /DNA_END=786 /DNA_ORIENTATION=-